MSFKQTSKVVSYTSDPEENLCIATRNKDFKGVIKALNQGAIPSSFGKTYLRCMGFPIDGFLNKNLTQEEQLKMLHLTGDHETIHTICSKLYTKDPQQNLLLAVKNQDVMGVEQALKEGANAQDPTWEQDYRANVIMVATRTGNLQILELLLKAGADVNFKDQNLHTPLIEAMVWRDISTVDQTVIFLINNKADVNVNFDDCPILTPLEVAKSYNYNKFRVLLEGMGAKS